MVVVLIHNIPVRFVNQMKLTGLSRSHPVHMATAAVVTNQQTGEKKKRSSRGDQPHTTINHDQLFLGQKQDALLLIPADFGV